MKKIPYSGLALALAFSACTTPNDVIPAKTNGQTTDNNNNNGRPQNNNCGNGQLNFGEDCDGSALGGNTCTNIGARYTGGTLACDKTCHFDLSGCTDKKPRNCGDGVVGKGEDCDGENLNGSKCTDFAGYTGGTLSCYDTCRFDKQNCIPEETTDTEDDNEDEDTSTGTCIGPDGYYIDGVGDGYPCNFDSDCGEVNSECFSYGFGINLCAGSSVDFNAAYDNYFQLGPLGTVYTPIEVADYSPCIDDTDCNSDRSYCYYGQEINVCLPKCDKSDRAVAPYSCERIYGHTNIDYGCVLKLGGKGKNGDECIAAEYDCVENAICNRGNCSTTCYNDGDCGTGFSCHPLTQTGVSHCFANSLIGKAQLGENCIANAECQNGLYCSADLVCSQNPARLNTNYKVKNIADGHACNQNFDCLSGICSGYRYENDSNSDWENIVYDRICGPYMEDSYNEYLLTAETSQIGEPCNYDEDCQGFIVFESTENEAVCWWANTDNYSGSMCLKTCYTDPNSCPDGYSCTEDFYGEMVCMPNHGTGTAGAPCKMDYWDCAEDFTCDTLTLKCQNSPF